ncbi:MAG TPA: YpdA family putative bacillithiol disulfide reductase [Gemmatimonadales bacterium]|jgi:thioredoxin reductase (NADPH)|nr:YpdA family putative bacillithiol disulfide reductase [Gemmatimonadales bacterium]
MTETTELLVVGAGPCGLAAAIAATRAGLDCVVLDRRTIVSTIERYPLQMTFFSTPERIEIGGIPFIASHEKPTRADGLIYYRRVAEHYRLDVRPGEDVTDVRREGDGGFMVEVTRPHDTRRYRAQHVVFATGYYDNPNYLGIPGEDLPHVAHYFLEGHPYWHRRVVVIGAGNSSVDAALECWRAGATVTLVHFGEGFDRTVKAWVLPDITNRVKQGSIEARWRTRVRAVTPTEVELVSDSGAVERLPCDAVLAMTGYHADTTLLQRLGVPVDEASGVPAHDERTMGTPVDGVYLAGVIASGNDANRLFIENARGHGDLIVHDILARRRPRSRTA